MKARVVSFNLWVGNKRPRANLLRLVTFLKFPRILVLQEAKNFRKSIPGYRAYRAPSHLTEGPEYRSTIFLVRRGSRVLRDDWIAVPDGEWQFKDNKREQRVFGRLRIAVGRKKRRRVFDVYGAHRVPLGPLPPRPINRKAWIAEHRTLALWDQGDHDSIWAADWNTRKGTHPYDKFSLRSLAEDLLAKIHVIGIDGFLTRGVKVLKVRKLKRKFGSDAHHPVVITFEL